MSIDFNKQKDQKGVIPVIPFRIIQLPKSLITSQVYISSNNQVQNMCGWIPCKWHNFPHQIVLYKGNLLAADFFWNKRNL